MNEGIAFLGGALLTLLVLGRRGSGSSSPGLAPASPPLQPPAPPSPPSLPDTPPVLPPGDVEVPPPPGSWYAPLGAKTVYVEGRKYLVERLNGQLTIRTGDGRERLSVGPLGPSGQSADGTRMAQMLEDLEDSPEAFGLSAEETTLIEEASV